MKKYLIFGIVGVVLAASVAVLGVVNKNQNQRIKFQEEQIEHLQESLKKAIGKTAISFSINPEITNKVTSAFGSTKNVTLQYYFTLDGQAMIVEKPDSVYRIVKEYD